MSAITEAIYNRMADDATLVALLNTYEGEPAIFTADPAPGDAELPYIVAAGEVAQMPFDTKTTLGRTVVRDIRCYTAATGGAVAVEEIAERVRYLFHRQALEIEGFVWLFGSCSGPIASDSPDAYGRVVTITFTVEEI